MGKGEKRGMKGKHEGYGRPRVSKFFFLTFLDSLYKMDLWRIFQRWGRVWDVYIAKKRNHWGEHFGFV